MYYFLGVIKWVKRLFWTFNSHYRPWNRNEIIIFLVITVGLTAVMLELLRKRKIVWSQFITVLFIITYLGFLASSMVFTRNIGDTPRYNLTLFWSWKAAFNGDLFLRKEVFANILILVPIGFLLPIVFQNCKYILWVSLISGIVVSSIIEVLQLVLRLGLFEWDDILDNSLGCLLGSMLMCGIRKAVQKIRS